LKNILLVVFMLVGLGLTGCDDTPGDEVADRGLFAVDERNTSRPTETDGLQDKSIVRYRLVRLDAGSLFSADPGEPQTLQLNLFPDVIVTAELEPASVVDGKPAFYTGQIAGQETSLVTLMVQNQTIFVNVRLGGRLYRVRPDENSLYRVEEVAPVTLPEDAPVKSK